MELDEIKILIELMKDSDLTELLIEREGSKLKLKREKYLSSIEAVKPAAAEVQNLQEHNIEEAGLATITSPIVGIYYSATSPEVSHFVEVGSSVKKGQVLCIVEAMKLMNEIESDTEGVVAKILVENGQAVEYGEPLFLIEPS